MKEATPTCMALTDLNFDGNIIPNAWYQHIRLEESSSNKRGPRTDIVAILVLSEIVYWYRPIEIRDEVTGQTTGWKRKFRADKYQIGYGPLAKKFGLGKEQIRRACKNLKRLGLITLEFRTVGENNNVLFVEPVAKEVKRITTTTPVDFKIDRVSTLKSTGIDFKIDTYTENPTKNTNGKGRNTKVNLSQQPSQEISKEVDPDGFEEKKEALKEKKASDWNAQDVRKYLQTAYQRAYGKESFEYKHKKRGDGVIVSRIKLQLIDKFRDFGLDTRDLKKYIDWVFGNSYAPGKCKEIYRKNGSVINFGFLSSNNLIGEWNVQYDRGESNSIEEEEGEFLLLRKKPWNKAETVIMGNRRIIFDENGCSRSEPIS